jgi:hypothetical protein
MTKHRIKTLLLGIGCLGFVWLFLPSPLCLIPKFCYGGLALTIFGHESYFNIPGMMSLYAFGTWILLTVGGIAAIWSALFKPEKYERKYCPYCSMETEQFLSGTNYEKGYKVYDALKRGESKAEREAHLISHEYSCEKCRKKNVVPITRPAFSGICAKCGGKMRYSKSSWKWVCDNCQTSVAALAPTGET